MSNDILDCLRSLPHAPAIAVFEDYGPINRTSGKIAQRAEICGILKYHLLHEFGIPVIATSPTSLKSFAVNNGKAAKKQIIDRANQLGYFPETSDEADAYFAARLGWKIIVGEKTGAAFHRTNPMNHIPYNQS
jgi:Holliday junction resolvasome RuvABC endonuclease subunit